MGGQGPGGGMGGGGGGRPGQPGGPNPQFRDTGFGGWQGNQGRPNIRPRPGGQQPGGGFGGGFGGQGRGPGGRGRDPFGGANREGAGAAFAGQGGQGGGGWLDQGSNTGQWNPRPIMQQPGGMIGQDPSGNNFYNQRYDQPPGQGGNPFGTSNMPGARPAIASLGRIEDMDPNDPFMQNRNPDGSLKRMGSWSPDTGWSPPDPGWGGGGGYSNLPGSPGYDDTMPTMGGGETNRPNQSLMSSWLSSMGNMGNAQPISGQVSTALGNMGSGPAYASLAPGQGGGGMGSTGISLQPKPGGGMWQGPPQNTMSQNPSPIQLQQQNPQQSSIGRSFQNPQPQPGYRQSMGLSG